MKRQTIALLACPVCHSTLEFDGQPGERIETGVLCCEKCTKVFPILDGIPQFVERGELTGLNRRFSNLYDWFSLIYPAFSRTAFALIGMNEASGRRELAARLDPQGGRVLEVSVGPGSNLPYLMERQDVGEIMGLDISPGQLRRCQNLVRRKHWDIDLFLANAEQLPYQENVFSGVLHMGGINFFDDKKAAIDEMIRVAKPGARIVIVDENQRGVIVYEKFLPGFKNSIKGRREKVKPPLDLVPPDMIDVRLTDIWKNWFYCLEFTKP